MGDELARPAAAGRGAITNLNAGFDASTDNVAVVIAVAGGGTWEWRFKPASLVAQDWFEHDAGVVVE